MLGADVLRVPVRRVGRQLPDVVPHRCRARASTSQRRRVRVRGPGVPCPRVPDLGRGRAAARGRRAAGRAASARRPRAVARRRQAAAARGPAGADEEHPPRLPRLRAFLLDRPGVAGARALPGDAQPLADGARPSTGPTRRSASHEAERINERFGTPTWTPIERPACGTTTTGRGGLRAVRRAAGEPGVRRDEPRGDGGPAR